MLCQDMIYIIDNIKIIDKTIVKNHLPFRSEKSKQHHSHKNNFFFLNIHVFIFRKHFKIILPPFNYSVILDFSLVYEKIYRCVDYSFSGQINQHFNQSINHKRSSQIHAHSKFFTISEFQIHNSKRINTKFTTNTYISKVPRFNTLRRL